MVLGLPRGATQVKLIPVLQEDSNFRKQSALPSGCPLFRARTTQFLQIIVVTPNSHKPLRQLCFGTHVANKMEVVSLYRILGQSSVSGKVFYKISERLRDHRVALWSEVTVLTPTFYTGWRKWRRVTERHLHAVHKGPFLLSSTQVQVHGPSVEEKVTAGFQETHATNHTTQHGYCSRRHGRPHG